MDRWSGRVCLVTGASVGIGAATARLLAKNGLKVVACARGVEQIQDICEEPEVKTFPGQIIPMKCDVSKEEEVLAMFSKIEQDLGGVDVCINNAGCGGCESLLEGTVAEWNKMIGVNVLGLCICTREAVKSMRARGVVDGHIINVSSMSAHRLPPGGSAFYSATKHAVKALTEGVRRELRGLKSGIRISQLSPGFVETEFHDRSNPNNPEKTKKMMSSFKHCLQAEDMASSIVYMLSVPAHMEVHDILVRPTEQKS